MNEGKLDERPEGISEGRTCDGTLSDGKTAVGMSVGKLVGKLCVGTLSDGKTAVGMSVGKLVGKLCDGTLSDGKPVGKRSEGDPTEGRLVGMSVGKT